MTLPNPAHVKYFAKTNFRNQHQLFGIKRSDMQYHCAIIGKTGSGKTNVLKSFILNDIENTSGFCLVDPHGDLIAEIFTSLSYEQQQKVYYLNFTDAELKLGYNPLRKVSYEKRSLVVSNILEVFEQIGGVKGWGPKLSHILRNCLLALLDFPGQINLSDVLRLLREKNYRQKVTKHIINDDVRDFFNSEFKNYNPKFDFVPIYNKIGGFLSHPSIRRVLIENKEYLSLRKIMDDGGILLINTAKGNIGTDASRLVGSLILTSLANLFLV